YSLHVVARDAPASLTLEDAAIALESLGRFGDYPFGLRAGQRRDAMGAGAPAVPFEDGRPFRLGGHRKRIVRRKGPDLLADIAGAKPVVGMTMETRILQQPVAGDARGQIPFHGAFSGPF